MRCLRARRAKTRASGHGERGGGVHGGSRGEFVYGGGGAGKRTDGEEEEEYDRRAATIRVDARKIRFVEHRVAVRLTSSEGNGVGESVRATGARVAVDDDVVERRRGSSRG